MDKQDRSIKAIEGALIADASALGCHWIYNQDKLAEIAAAHKGLVSFVERQSDYYANDYSYDAHGKRQNGSNTQYGEALKVAIRALIAGNGAYNVADHVQHFSSHYGPGGTYVGYIDHATKQTLIHITQEIEPTGTDDMQLPALASLPAIVVVAPESIDTAIQVTNNNELSRQAGRLMATLLDLVVNGQPLAEALPAAASQAQGPFLELVTEALQTTEKDSQAFGLKTGIACNLVEAVPLIFHILKHTSSYEAAIEMNNRTGGDNAGRAIVIGAVAGANYADQPDKHIPSAWVANYLHADEMSKMCQALFK